MTTPLRPRIEYGTLLKNYTSSLTSQLRSFRSSADAPSFLETWVPDEDDARSLAGILEAAYQEGVRGLELRFDAETLGRIPRETLQGVCLRFGTVTVVASSSSEFVLDLSLERDAPRSLADAAPTEERSAAGPSKLASPSNPSTPAQSDVQATFERVLKAHPFPSHRVAGRPSPSESQFVGETPDGGLALTLDRSTLSIESAHYWNADETTGLLLDGLCEIVRGRPLREGLDHGPVLVAHAVLQKLPQRPVPGIAVPEALHPRFGALRKLLTQVESDYGARAGALAPHSTFESTPSHPWVGMSEPQRLDAVNTILSDLPSPSSPPSAPLTCLAVEKDTRLILAFTSAVSPAVKPSLLFRAEQAIKRRLDPSLVVYLSEMRDENKLRRLRQYDEELP